MYFVLYVFFQVFRERMLGLTVGVCISSVGVMAIVLFLPDNSSVTKQSDKYIAMSLSHQLTDVFANTGYSFT